MMGQARIINGERRYNTWAGNPAGTREDPTRCIEEVWPNERGGGAHRYQCKRKRGHGPDGLYCKQHSPEAKDARKAAGEARYRKSTLGFAIDSQRQAVSEVARQVFKQQASFDDLETAVAKLEQLIAERNALRLEWGKR